MFRIKQLFINHDTDPVGTGSDLSFHWYLESDSPDTMQRSYWLQIALDQDFYHMVFDSGEIWTDASANRKADGFTPESLTKYFVRVRVYSQRGEDSGFSPSSCFVTGILMAGEWNGDFITAEQPEDVPKFMGTYVHGGFRITKKPVQAYVCATALGLYHLYINGQRAGEDEMAPGWTSYRQHLLCQTYDVTSLLIQGDNVIGAMLGSGWFKGRMGSYGRTHIYGDRTAFLCQLRIRYEDGTIQQFATGPDWRGCPSPVTAADIYDGETYDARLEQDGWCRPVFAADSRWKNVSTVKFPKEGLTPQGGGRIRVMEELPAREILTTPAGDTVIDFGQNLTGRVHFYIKGRPGERVELQCFEILDPLGNVYTDNLRTAKQTITYICRDETGVWFHPSFSFQGFRYIWVASYPGPILKENFKAQVLHTHMRPTGSFTCSNPMLNQLQHNILWGLKGNFLDVPTDCPQRDERLGWTCDAQVFSRTACFLMDTHTFYAKWLLDLYADQTPEGGIPHVVPDIITGYPVQGFLKQGTHSAAGWADAAVIIPWTLYLVYGDTDILIRQYDSMKAWVEFMRSHADGPSWSYRLQFGDWVALDAEEGSYFGATPNDYVCSAYYAYSTGILARTAGLLEYRADAGIYQALYQSVSTGFCERYLDAFGDLKVHTQTAYVLALYFRLLPVSSRERAAACLADLIRREDGHLVTGFLGTPYICHALSQNGYEEEAFALLMKEDLPSWLYQVKMGATTIWEHWDGLKPNGTLWDPHMNSFNHYAYGAIGDWMYRVLAGIGIDEDAPGYKHILINPYTPPSLAEVSARLDTMYGPLFVHWRRTAGEVVLNLEIPTNTTATVSPLCLKRWVELPERYSDLTGSDSPLCLGSGRYGLRFG
ncbi:alpha-L-rhamnosidase [Diplocloster hominis]|uniref:alpha-L-rhamnosidase n=1 Tax=Diplocloster hominis TaxID=3079010 RepID=UPI0031BB6133